MKVLVTGGTGFIGRHTVEMLVEEGHEVTVLDRYPQRFAQWSKEIKGDINLLLVMFVIAKRSWKRSCRRMG